MRGKGNKGMASAVPSPNPSAREPLQIQARVIGYVRVSTSDQATNGVSLDEQERRIRGYGTAHGLDVIRIERDDGISAKTTTNRPALLRALRMLKRHKAGGLVVVKLDRLSRSLQDVLDLVARAEREKWELHSIGENLDTSTPHGRFVVHLFGALAQLEREQIGERTRNGMAELRRQGKRGSRFAPFGFRFKDGLMVPVEEEQSILGFMLAMRGNGEGPTAIARELNGEGIENPRTDRPWTPGNVGTILKTAEKR